MKLSSIILAIVSANVAVAHHAEGAGKPMSTSYVTSHDIQTTVVTITSCSGGVCSTKPMSKGLTTMTENHSVMTTYVPLPTDGGESGKGHKSMDGPHKSSLETIPSGTSLTGGGINPDISLENRATSAGLSFAAAAFGISIALFL